MDFVEYFRFFFLPCTSPTEPPVHFLSMLQGGQEFCTLANLFAGRQKIVTDFLTAPPPFMSQRSLSILQCLLSHCCRQFFFLCAGTLVL